MALEVAEAEFELATGDAIAAESHFLEALRLLLGDVEDPSAGFDPYIPPSHVSLRDLSAAKIYFGLARSLSWQGRLIEAESWGRKALSNLKYYSPEVSSVLGQIFFEYGRYDDGQVMAQSAIDHLQSRCIPLGSLIFAHARALLAKVLVAKGDWKGAREQFDKIYAAESNETKAYQARLRDDPNRGLAYLFTGEPDRALGILGRAVEKDSDRFGPTHYNTMETESFRALALAKAGQEREALEALKRSFPVLLERWREIGDESVTLRARAQRLRLIAEGYIDLLLSEEGKTFGNQHGLNPDEATFQLAEAVIARAVHKDLISSSIRRVAGNEALAGLIRDRQDLERRLAAAQSGLSQALYVVDRDDNPELLEELQNKVDHLKTALVAVEQEVASKYPEYAELTNPEAPTTDEVRAVLQPGEVLLSTFVGDHGSFIWAVPATGPVAVGKVSLNKRQIAGAAAELRRALDPKVTLLGEIPAFDLQAAYNLYEALLKPVESAWRDAKALIVVADGPLGQLPLSILPTEPIELAADERILFEGYQKVSWLARDHGVTYLPSVASLTTLRDQPAGPDARRAFLGFADPLFSEEQALAAVTGEDEVQTAALVERGILPTRAFPIRLRSVAEMDDFDSAALAHLPRLPDTADEVRSIAVALNADLTRDVFLGKAANEATLKGLDLEGYKVLAFATHGLIPGDLDGLTQPALALTAPQVAGVEGDGLLTMSEILGLKLDADWVVLSACNTAAGEGAGAEAVSGLGRAFFYAGARALLVSNWPVETTSAKALTTDIFRRQFTDPNLSRAEALHQAMVALIDGPGYVDKDGRTVFSYAHPIFWAPFTLVGDGGSSQQTGS